MTETIEIPDFLTYPKIYNLTDVKELVGQFCYIFKHYPNDGRQLLVMREAGQVCLRLADWRGQEIDPTDKTQLNSQVVGYSSFIVHFMSASSIPKAIFYFSSENGEPRLVDMRLSHNKFCGPGYLNDFIGKMGIPIQEKVGDPVVLKSDVIESIVKKDGIYTHGKYVVKPSKFKLIIRGDDVLPMYGVITNETKAPVRANYDGNDCDKANSNVVTKENKKKGP